MLENVVLRWFCCHMLTVKIALTVIQEDVGQEDDVI